MSAVKLKGKRVVGPGASPKTAAESKAGKSKTTTTTAMNQKPRPTRSTSVETPTIMALREYNTWSRLGIILVKNSFELIYVWQTN